MKYIDLRDFIFKLQKIEELKRISVPISPYLEITEICDRTLRSSGPALLFENVKGSNIPVIANLFGTTRRVAMSMGAENMFDVRRIGCMLARLKMAQPPKNLKDILGLSALMKSLWNMVPKEYNFAPCQTIILKGKDVDLNLLPIQHCWPDDVAPLITWGLVITKGPRKKRHNLGVYRQQVLKKNKVIIRWLAHRGGALDFYDHCILNRGAPYPVAVALGVDPATTLGAVIPVPDSLSEYQFAGLLRGSRTQLVKSITSNLRVPATAEIILEGHIYPDKAHPSGYEHALEGPYGDHTGYYNEQELFPVLTIDLITTRQNPIYHSTYTGKPPDEPSVLGATLNELFIPLLQQQFNEIKDFYLPPEGCSYRMAIVQIEKSYIGHAKRVMFGVWSFLRQFMYTKFIIVVDNDIDIRNWKEIIWALTTRVDPMRDMLIINNTPIDYLDFASPVSGLGSKIGIDATNKWPGETNRMWGRVIVMSDSVKQYINKIWKDLNI